jgi:transposase
MGHLSTKKGQSDSIEWRRSKVLELSSEGYSQREIAQMLQIGKSVANRDVLFLRKQARENLQYHIRDRIPEEYQNCMTGMKRNLKQTLEIAETAADPKTKLQARAIANDCYKYIIDLATNGVVITDAIKYVQGKMDHLNKTEKALLQDIKEKEHKIDGEVVESETEAEEKTTNGVF